MRALTKTTKRTKRIIILGLAAFGLMAGVAVATPGLLVSASTPVRGTIAEPFKVETDGLVELKTKGPIDVADQTITIQPGGHTGWHSHPGPALVVIKQGTLTLYDGDEGTTPVEVSVTYLLPVGAGPRIDVPRPGNCTF
jgi:hypothetical protein